MARGRIASRVGGALGAFACLAAAVVVALGVSGQFEAFNRNRGMLQLFVAIPVACLVTSAALAYFRVSSRAEMLWALLPAGLVVLVGVGALGPGFAAWPWSIGVGAPVLVPWVLGLYLGSVARRARARKKT